MYGTKVEVKEMAEGKNYLQPGVHKVAITEMKLDTLATANYNGQICRFTISDEDGATLDETLFPFKYRADATDYNKNPLDEAAQQTEYLQKVKELFGRAMATDEIYDATVASATDFNTFIAAISTKVVKANGGLSFWQLVKADKNNYSKIAMHKGGSSQRFTEGEPCRIKWDASKWGKKVVDEGAVEKTANIQTDDLPF